ncbi:MAG TPA: DNA polymerase/3'-5' exonuclease PolX [Ktedonobacteraceae bacterium]|nr:DNA polymerase/3'-5' exonuclease PolX [Ktedonobacteraceae bacterium]
MDKNQVANLLEQVATLLELKEGSNVFEVRAYQNAARAVSSLDNDIEELTRAGKLKGTPGLGATIIKRIEELIFSGKMAFYDELVRETPEIKLTMLRIPGVGPKKINAIHSQLHINSLDELVQACQEHKVAALPGFGKKTEDKILQGIAFLAQHADRHLYSDVEEQAQRVQEALSTLPGIVRMQVAGSLRRKRETVKDIDMVLSVADDANDEVRTRIMDVFTSQPGVKAITGKGLTKSSIVLGSGINMDLRVVGDSQFPYTLHHFTGSKEHHIPLRRRALSMGMTINDYGLFRGKEPDPANLVPCTDERDIYAALGLDYIEPELREDTGEIDAAARHQLPDLVQESDIKGVLHAHSTWSDGHNSIREMIEACLQRGFTYLGITDHSKAAAYAGGLNAEALKRQHEEIERLQVEYQGRIRIFKGIECDILRDGALDFPDEVLATLDFVVASIHSQFTLSQEEQTRRMLHAISNPYVDIIGHPTGRLLLNREGYPLDMDAVIDAAARHGVCIEINAHPSRLDLDWRYLRRARDKGMKIPINPDAHATDGIDVMRYGVGIARKGWLQASDVLNTMSATEVEEFFKKRRTEKNGS